MNHTEYLLVCLMEECAEIQQIASKSLRFGLNNHRPDEEETNFEALRKELTDLDAIRLMLSEEVIFPLSYSDINEMSKKINKVNYYMAVSIECGTLHNSEGD